MNKGYVHNNEQFEELLMLATLQQYLKASPFEAGERSRLDDALTEDYYYKHLYAHSEAAEEKINDILLKVNRDEVHNFILAGYKGCGKSTFVRYFLRKSNIRSRIINFDDNWEPNIGIINNLAAYLDRLVYDDLFQHNEDDSCKMVNTYIELFCNDEDNKDAINGIDTQNYFEEFGKKLMYARMCKHKTDKKTTLDYFNNNIKHHVISGTISNVLMLILFCDIAYRIANNLSEKCCIVFENLDVIYNTKDIPEFALNVIAFRNNVDKLVTALKYNGEFLGNPTHNYILIFVMREITKGEFSNYIEHFSDGKVYFQPYTDISEVYNIHSIVNKRVERLREITQKVHDKTENENVFQIQRRSTLILRLLDDDYLRKRLFGLFDNDYRTFVEVISSFDLEDSKFFSACEKLLAIKDAKDEGWSAFGYRSVIFREIFNIFVKEGYIDKLKSFEYSGRNDGVERSINLDRMILLYLSNNVVNRDVPEEQKECRFISLETLFKEITKFCDNHKSIIDALWQMYNLRKEEKWNHLITFENVDVISYEELQREMTAYENNTSDIDFAHVKITLAGENYLNHVLPHFEFYAARGLNGKGHSLFAFTAEEWCDLKEINKIFKLQRKEITNCCKRLYKFFMDIFEKMPEFSGGAFLKSDFAAIKYSYTKKDITRMYHCERILHSNIGYVNRLRFYVAHIMDEVLDKKGFENDVDITLLLSYYPSNCEKLDCLWPENIKPNKIGKCILVKKANEDNYEILQKVLIKMKNCSDNICIEMPLESCIQIIKACINARLVKAIKKYIGMFGIDSGKQCAMYSESTKYLCIAFMACINEKIQPSGYMDLKTPIDAVTGTELIKKKRKNENCDKDKERHEESKKRHILRMSVKHEKEGNEL